MKKEDGAFTMHADGENDVRGAYCAVSVATLTGIATDALFEGAQPSTPQHVCDGHTGTV
jgi:protein farnesyltransferase subunit beta